MRIRKMRSHSVGEDTARIPIKYLESLIQCKLQIDDNHRDYETKMYERYQYQREYIVKYQYQVKIGNEYVYQYHEYRLNEPLRETIDMTKITYIEIYDERNCEILFSIGSKIRSNA